MATCSGPVITPFPTCDAVLHANLETDAAIPKADCRICPLGSLIMLSVYISFSAKLTLRERRVLVFSVVTVEARGAGQRDKLCKAFVTEQNP